MREIANPVRRVERVNTRAALPWVYTPTPESFIHVSTKDFVYGPRNPSTEEIARISSIDGSRQKILFSSAGLRGMNIFEVFRMDIKEEDGTVRQHLCLPVAMGCPTGCTMCEIGDFFSQNLGPGDVISAARMSLEGWVNGSKIAPPKIMLLGGGEIGFYPQAVELLNGLRRMFPKAGIITSTVGVDTPISKQVNDLIAQDPNMNMQVSICSLDDNIRSQIIPNRKRMSVDESIKYAIDYAAKTGKTPHISLFMLKDVDTPQSILRQVLEKVPRFVHITLTDIVQASERWQFDMVTDEEYGEAAKLLQNAGYDTSVYRPAIDPVLRDSCGLYMPGTPQLNASIKSINQHVRSDNMDGLVEIAAARRGQEFSVGDIAVEQTPFIHVDGKPAYTRMGLVVDKQPLKDDPINHVVTILTVASNSSEWRPPGLVTSIRSYYNSPAVL